MKKSVAQKYLDVFLMANNQVQLILDRALPTLPPYLKNSMERMVLLLLLTKEVFCRQSAQEN